MKTTIRLFSKTVSIFFDLYPVMAGLETQGPPDRLHPAEYMRYISLSVGLSRDRADWKVRVAAGSLCTQHTLLNGRGGHVNSIK
jgi:hypothetical protein